MDNKTIYLKSRRLFIQRAAIASCGALCASGVNALTLSRKTSDPAAPTGSGAPLRVGLILPLSGPLAGHGASVERGFKLAALQMQGSLAGRSLETITADEGFDPSSAHLNATRLLALDRVDILVGSVSPACSLAIAKAAKDRGRAFILTSLGFERPASDPSYFPGAFNIASNPSSCAKGLAAHIAGLGIRLVATLSFPSAADRFDLASFKKELLSLGISTVDSVVSNPSNPLNPPDAQTEVSLVSAARPEALAVFLSGKAAASFFNARRSLALQTPVFGLGTLTFGMEAFPGANTDGVTTAFHYSPSIDSPANLAFSSSHQKAFNRTPDFYAVHGHDAALLLERALTTIGSNPLSFEGLSRAISSAVIDSPRGPVFFDSKHNAVQPVVIARRTAGIDAVVSTSAPLS